MRHRYLLADVFTDRPFGGNSLAVFPEGAGIAGATMQLVARELNLAETVFVLPPENPRHHFKLRIFTPTTELPFAGHPTVGAAFLLAADGHVALAGEETRIVLEEGVGPVPVMIRAREGRPVFSQLSAARLPEFDDAVPSRDALAPVLGLRPEDLLDGEFAPQVVSCGLPFLFVPLRDREALRRARADSGRWATALAGCAAQEVYLFVRDAGGGDVDIHARMFAPRLGIAEDPATGSAAAALAGYFARRTRTEASDLHWTISQGVDMGRPSRLEVEAERGSDGALTAVRVGGSSVWIGEGVMELP